VVQSVCVIPGADEDEVWISVTRTIDETEYVYVERMNIRTQGAVEDSVFVDSAYTYDSTATSTITGLDHLEGVTVKVLADGVVFDDAVVSSGSITLKLDGVTTTASVVQVGLGYTAVLQPMRIVQNGPQGPSLGAVTRIPEMKISFLNTDGAKYGPSESNLTSINFNDERWEDAAYITDLFSGDVVVTMPGGFSRQNPLLVVSDQPLPMTVKAIVASFEETGR
jgi:hypothetical protein